MGSATNSSSVTSSSVPPVALEFMTKVAQSVSEPTSKPVINNNSSNSIGGNNVSNEVVTAGTPTVPSCGTAVPPQTTVVTTPVMVPPGPINYASVVMKPVNQQQQKSPAAGTVPTSSASASTGNSADPSVPKSTHTTSGNRSTTSSSSSAPIHPQQPSKASWSNKVSGPSPNVTTAPVPNKQLASSTVTTTPSVNHVSKGTVVVNNEGKQQTSDFKVDDDVKSSSAGSQSVTTPSAMGSKVSKVDGPTVPVAVSGVQPSPKVNEVVPPSKPPSASVQSSVPSVPKIIPKANSTGNLESYSSDPHSSSMQVHHHPSQLISTPSLGSSGNDGVIKTVADSSDGNVVSSSSDPCVKPSTTGSQQTSNTSSSKTKGLPAIPEVTTATGFSGSNPPSVSSPSPTLINTDTKVSGNSSSNLVNDSKVTSTKESNEQIGPADETVASNEVASNEVASKEVASKEVVVSSSTVNETPTNEETNEEGGRIIEEGELIDEDAVIEESESIDPALDIDRYHKDGHWRYGRDDLLLLSKLPMSRSKPPFDKDSEASMKLGSLIKDKVTNWLIIILVLI